MGNVTGAFGVGVDGGGGEGAVSRGGGGELAICMAMDDGACGY